MKKSPVVDWNDQFRDFRGFLQGTQLSAIVFQEVAALKESRNSWRRLSAILEDTRRLGKDRAGARANSPKLHHQGQACTAGWWPTVPERGLLPWGGVDALGFMSLGGVRENMWIMARGLDNRVSCGERLWVGIYGGRCNGGSNDL